VHSVVILHAPQKNSAKLREKLRGTLWLKNMSISEQNNSVVNPIKI
jgi:hypothetical protein